eukprot:3847257-Lingulodinium_polyedra.AAC.1
MINLPEGAETARGRPEGDEDHPTGQLPEDSARGRRLARLDVKRRVPPEGQRGTWPTRCRSVAGAVAGTVGAAVAVTVEPPEGAPKWGGRLSSGARRPNAPETARKRK